MEDGGAEPPATVTQLSDDLGEHVVGQRVVGLPQSTEPTAGRTEGDDALEMARIDRGDDQLQPDALRSDGGLEPFGSLLLELAGRFPTGSVHDPADRTDLALHPADELPNGRPIGEIADLVAGIHTGRTELRQPGGDFDRLLDVPPGPPRVAAARFCIEHDAALEPLESRLVEAQPALFDRHRPGRSDQNERQSVAGTELPGTRRRDTPRTAGHQPHASPGQPGQRSRRPRTSGHRHDRRPFPFLPAHLDRPGALDLAEDAGRDFGGRAGGGEVGNANLNLRILPGEILTEPCIGPADGTADRPADPEIPPQAGHGGEGRAIGITGTAPGGEEALAGEVAGVEGRRAAGHPILPGRPRGGDDEVANGSTVLGRIDPRDDLRGRREGKDDRLTPAPGDHRNELRGEGATGPIGAGENHDPFPGEAPRGHRGRKGRERQAETPGHLRSCRRMCRSSLGGGSLPPCGGERARGRRREPTPPRSAGERHRLPVHGSGRQPGGGRGESVADASPGRRRQQSPQVDMPRGIPSHLHKRRQRRTLTAPCTAVDHPALGIDQADRAIDRHEGRAPERGERGCEAARVGQSAAAREPFDGDREREAAGKAAAAAGYHDQPGVVPAEKPPREPLDTDQMPRQAVRGERRARGGGMTAESDGDATTAGSRSTDDDIEPANGHGRCRHGRLEHCHVDPGAGRRRPEARGGLGGDLRRGHHGRGCRHELAGPVADGGGLDRVDDRRHGAGHSRQRR